MNQPRLKKHVNQSNLKINSKSSPGQALTGEASKVVDTLAILPTIVVLGLAALVEVLDSRDRVERAGDVEVPVPNVVRTCLDNIDQLPFLFVLLLLIVFTHQQRIATPWPSCSSSRCCFRVLALTALCLWICL